MPDILETPLELTETTCYAIIEIPKGTNEKLEMSMEKPNHPIEQDVKKGEPRFVPQVYHDLNYNLKQYQDFQNQTPISIYNILVNDGIQPLKYLFYNDDEFTNELDKLKIRANYRDEHSSLIETFCFKLKDNKKYREVQKIIQAIKDEDDKTQIQKLKQSLPRQPNHKLKQEIKAQIKLYEDSLTQKYKNLEQEILKERFTAPIKKITEAYTSKYKSIDPSLTPEVLQELYGENFDKGYNLFHYGALPQTYEDPTEGYTKPEFLTTFGLKEEQAKLKDINGKEMNFEGLTGDGDPLDVCILDFRENKEPGDIAREAPKRHYTPINSSSKIQFRILGVFAMIDDGEIDWKVVGYIYDVPRVLSDLYPTIENIRRWFKYYKCSLDEGGGLKDGEVHISELLSQDVALKVIEHYHNVYLSTKSEDPFKLRNKIEQYAESISDLENKIRILSQIEKQRHNTPLTLSTKFKKSQKEIKIFTESLKKHEILKKKAEKKQTFMISFISHPPKTVRQQKMQVGSNAQIVNNANLPFTAQSISEKFSVTLAAAKRMEESASRSRRVIDALKSLQTTLEKNITITIPINNRILTSFTSFIASMNQFVVKLQEIKCDVQNDDGTTREINLQTNIVNQIQYILNKKQEMVSMAVTEINRNILPKLRIDLSHLITDLEKKSAEALNGGGKSRSKKFNRRTHKRKSNSKHRGGSKKSIRKRKQSRRKTKKQKKQKNRRK